MAMQIAALQERLPVFIEQDAALRRVFFRGQDISLHMAACLLFSQTDDTALPLQETADMIRRTPLCFDDAAAELLPLLTAMTAAAQNPDLMLYRMQTAFRTLSQVFIPSARLVSAAAALAESGVPTEEYSDYAHRIFRIFEEIHAAHPILTGYEDLGVFTLYALYETVEQDLIAHAEAYAERLDDDFIFRNSVQALGHAIAFHDDVESACVRVQQLNNAAKAAKINLRKGNLPTAIAPFVLLDMSPEAFAQQLAQADKQLAKAEAFSPLIVSSKDRLLFAAMAAAANAIRSTRRETEPQYAFRAAVYSITGAHAADSAGYAFI